MNETTTLSGEVTVTVTDETGRQRRQSRHRNRVFDAGTVHIAECLAGQISGQQHFVEIGSGVDTADGGNLQQLIELLKSKRVNKPAVEDNELRFTTTFNANEPMTVAESGLRFKFTRGEESDRELLYNRAEIDPAVDLNVNDKLKITWRIFFDWIAAP